MGEKWVRVDESRHPVSSDPAHALPLVAKKCRYTYMYTIIGPGAIPMPLLRQRGSSHLHFATIPSRSYKTYCKLVILPLYNRCELKVRQREAALIGHYVAYRIETRHLHVPAATAGNKTNIHPSCLICRP